MYKKNKLPNKDMFFLKKKIIALNSLKNSSVCAFCCFPGHLPFLYEYFRPGK